MARLYEVNNTTALAAKVDALTKSVMENNPLAAKVDALTQRFDQFMLASSSSSKVVCHVKHVVLGMQQHNATFLLLLLHQLSQ